FRILLNSRLCPGFRVPPIRKRFRQKRDPEASRPARTAGLRSSLLYQTQPSTLFSNSGLQNPAQLKALPGLPSPSDQEGIRRKRDPEASRPARTAGLRRRRKLAALPDAAEHAVFKFRAS